MNTPAPVNEPAPVAPTNAYTPAPVAPANAYTPAPVNEPASVAPAHVDEPVLKRAKKMSNAEEYARSQKLGVYGLPARPVRPARRGSAKVSSANGHATSKGHGGSSSEQTKGTHAVQGAANSPQVHDDPNTQQTQEGLQEIPPVIDPNLSSQPEEYPEDVLDEVNSAVSGSQTGSHGSQSEPSG